MDRDIIVEIDEEELPRSFGQRMDIWFNGCISTALLMLFLLVAVCGVSWLAGYSLSEPTIPELPHCGNPR